jgi:hypothetical protein
MEEKNRVKVMKISYRQAIEKSALNNFGCTVLVPNLGNLHIYNLKVFASQTVV